MVPVDSFIKNVLKILIKESVSIFFRFPKLVILWNKIPWTLLILVVVNQKNIYTWRGSCNGLTCWRAGNATSRFSKFKSDFPWVAQKRVTYHLGLLCFLLEKHLCFSRLALLARHGIDWGCSQQTFVSRSFAVLTSGMAQGESSAGHTFVSTWGAGMRGLWGPLYKDPNDSGTSRLLTPSPLGVRISA